MKAKDFDQKFDRGQSVLPQLDLSKAARPGQEQRRVNVDFPTWMIQSLDKEARTSGSHAPVDHQGLDCRAFADGGNNVGKRIIGLSRRVVGGCLMNDPIVEEVRL